MSTFLFRTFRPAFVGHLSGFGALLLLSMAALSFTDPTAAATGLALAALSVGALVCGLVSRMSALSFPSALIAGFCYAIVPWLLALFTVGREKPGALSFGQATLAAFLFFVVAVLLPVLLPKKRRSRSPAKRRRAMERRFREKG